MLDKTVKMAYRDPYISALAGSKGWTEVPMKTDYVQRFERGGATVDVWPTTGTVGTYVDHPSQGKTQLYRRDMGDSLGAVFDNPRVHTGRGYHSRR
jgi:hypothetical protein